MTLQTGTQTPWGPAQTVKRVADGIWTLDTSGHGGYYVAPMLRLQMPAGLASIKTYCGAPGWYEEDCDWAIVAAAFPQHFSAQHRYFAFETLKGLAYAAAGFAAFLATLPGQAFKAEHDAFFAEHAEHFTIGAMSTGGGGWRCSAYSLNGERRACWDQTDYPEYGQVFPIESVVEAGHVVTFENLKAPVAVAA